VIGIASSQLPVHAAKVAVAVVLLAMYAFYVFRAVSNSGEIGGEEELEPLRLYRVFAGAESPPTWLALLQVAIALGLIIGAAYTFVDAIERVSHALSIPPLALSLLIAPLATELPETFNSVIWVRQGKD